MLTVLEILMIAANIPVLVWALLPVKRVPRFLDFMPSVSVLFMILHLLIDNEPVRFRFVPLYTFTIIVFLATIVHIFKHNDNQPKHRIAAAFGRVFCLLSLVLCVLFPTVILPFNSLPQPTGNYDVGTVTCDLTDENRIETFSETPGQPRRIAVQFWYPTDRTGSEVNTDIKGAPVSASQKDYPVVVFSHGAFGVRMSNASVCRELASHGYIVASIDHTYHSFYTSFADGSTVPVSPVFLNEVLGVTNGAVSAKETFDITQKWLETRTADIELTIDSLEAGKLAAEASILNGHMDITKIGLFGHSLGGASSAQVCRERDDIGAVIIIDGTMLGDITGIDSSNKEIYSDEAFNKPLMLMYNSLYLTKEGKQDSYRPNINAFNNSTEKAYSVCIKDTGHMNFTDLPRISPFLSGMLGTGTVDPYNCIKLMNDYSLAFFDEHLKGKPSALLDKANSPDGVVFETR